jgi:hypothetical protein
MEDVFTLGSEYVYNETENEYFPDVNAPLINLFTSCRDVDLETVKRASAFQVMRGEDWMLQNLLWSRTKLLDSCDNKLRQKIEEKTIGWPVHHSTGPVYFKIMLENILLSSPESLQGLMTLLQDTKLNNFDGENVAEFASFSRGANEQLQNNNALPLDVLLDHRERAESV